MDAPGCAQQDLMIVRRKRKQSFGGIIREEFLEALRRIALKQSFQGLRDDGPVSPIEIRLELLPKLHGRMLAFGWCSRKDSGRELDLVIRLVQIDAEAHPSEPVEESPLAREVLVANASYYQHAGFKPPWIAYLVTDGDRCVGTCAFKGPPRDGRVEIAYFTFPQYEGEGFATQMVDALVKIAHTEEPEVTVAAQTFTQDNASTHILEKFGFRCIGTIDSPEDGLVWEWRLLGNEESVG